MWQQMCSLRVKGRNACLPPFFILFCLKQYENHTPNVKFHFTISLYLHSLGLHMPRGSTYIFAPTLSHRTHSSMHSQKHLSYSSLLLPPKNRATINNHHMHEHKLSAHSISVTVANYCGYHSLDFYPI